MELKEALLNRRSVRNYLPKAVEKEKIDQLLHAGMSGPSACNCRPWEFWVVTEPQKVELLRRSARYTNINAPMAIVVCGNRKNALPDEMSEFWVQDCSSATENILLCAVDNGLGTVWCGIYPNAQSVEKVQKALELSEEVVPLNIIYVGYPAENPQPRDQYEASKIHFVE